MAPIGASKARGTSRVVAFAGPRGEQEQDACPGLRRERVALRRLEPQKRARTDDGAFGSGRHLNEAVDHEHPSVLPDLMLTELLARLEHDENRARTVVL